MLDFLGPGLKFLGTALWIVVPVILVFIFLDIWLFFKRLAYKNSIVWKTLELKIPRDIIKSPKAMEYIFSAMHASYSFGIKFWDKWLKGEVENWYSLEIIGRAHGIRFLARLPEQYRNLFESAIYAQYPDVEINEVEDYVDDFPPRLPNKIYDVWGADFILTRDNSYPIRTYPEFDAPGKDDEKKFDPLAHLTEVMSKLKESEAIWLQILIRPTDDGWKSASEGVIDELLGKKKLISAPWPVSWFSGLVEFLGNLVVAPFTSPTWAEGGEVKSESKSEMKPGMHKIIEAIQNKTSKLGFESVMRFLYIDRRDNFSRGNITAFISTLRQFNSQDLNSFKSNSATMPSAKSPFKKSKIERKKKIIYDNYRIRHFPKKFSILNTEELATLYHFPLSLVRAPLLRRMEAKKSGPPEGLPVEF